MEISSLKKCSKCGEEKSLSEFQFRKDSNNYQSRCKLCISKSQKEFRDNNKELVKQRKHLDYLKHKEHILQKSKEYRENNKEACGQRDKDYYKNNKEKIIQNNKIYVEEHKEEIAQYKHNWNVENKLRLREKDKLEAREKRKDPNYRLLANLRTRLGHAIKDSYKSKRTLELLGCSVEFLKQHLEKQFTKGMSWENRGVHGWHIDHIRPCCTFDLTDPKRQEECFNYTNLQPLWEVDNLKKSKKYVV